MKKDLYLKISAHDFYNYYLEFDFHEMPLLTNDGIVIPKKGLSESLNKPINKSVPLMIGSNRDEVKLWIGTSLYFVKPKFSLVGSIVGVPGVHLLMKMYLRHSTIIEVLHGKLEELKILSRVYLMEELTEIFAYRYDWDDHRTWPVANFKKLIGAAHATEIPLLTGNNKLVGNYGFIIYPPGPSKRVYIE